MLFQSGFLELDVETPVLFRVQPYYITVHFYLDTASDIRITSCNIYWAFPQLTQAGGDIKEKNTIRVKINKK